MMSIRIRLVAVKEGFELHWRGLVRRGVAARGTGEGDRDERRKAAAGTAGGGWLTGEALVELEALGGLRQARSCPADQCCGAPCAAIRTTASIGFNGRFRLAAMSA